MKLISTYSEFVSESNWYRGHTTNTRPSDYIWMSSDKNQAETYSSMNKIIQGGDSLLSEYDINLNDYNVLDLSDYDMNDRLEDYEIENFLDEIGVDYDYEDLFDYTEDDIPLSRVVNNITNEIMSSYDILLIKEDDIDTILIKQSLL